jgi:transposase-like protein
MHSTETKQQFVILRAKGRGLCGIAEELGVSSSTAYTWDSQFQDEIAELRAMEIEAIRERTLPNYQQELSYLAEELKRVQAILRERDYGYVNTDQLYWYQSHLLSRIDRKCPPLPPPKRSGLSAVETVTPDVKTGPVTPDVRRGLTDPETADLTSPDPKPNKTEWKTQGV